jgi:hypothetical protein
MERNSHMDATATRVNDVNDTATTPQMQATVGQDFGQDRGLDRDRIAQRAYERFQMRGGAPGFDQEDWYEAERELTGQ